MGWKLLLLFLATAHLEARSFFVSANGSDNNDGLSLATPFQSIEKINSLMLLPGDSINLAGGEKFSGTLSIRNVSGTLDEPITITSYTTASGEKAEIIAPEMHEGIQVRNAEYIHISKFKITGPGPTPNICDSFGHTLQVTESDCNKFELTFTGNNGIAIEKDLSANKILNSISVNDTEISGFRMAGISLWADPGLVNGFDNLRFENLDIHNNGFAGMWTYGCNATAPLACFTNIYVGRSKFHHNPGISYTDFRFAQQTGNGIFLRNVNGGLIEHCLAYNNGILNNTKGGGPVGFGAVYSRNIIIQYNESYSNHSQEADGDGFDLDGGVQDSILQYNYSHENDGAGFLVWQFPGPSHSNNIVRFNISQNDSRRGWYGAIHVGAWPNTNLRSVVNQLQIYGNTVFLNLPATGLPKGPPYAFRAGSNFSNGSITNMQVINNIFMTNDGVPLLRMEGIYDQISFKGNNYFSNNSPFVILWNEDPTWTDQNPTNFFDLKSWRMSTMQETMDGYNVGNNLNPKLRAAGLGPAINNINSMNNLNAYRLDSDSQMKHNGLDYSLFNIDPGPVDFYGNSISPYIGFSIGANNPK